MQQKIFIIFYDLRELWFFERNVISFSKVA